MNSARSPLKARPLRNPGQSLDERIQLLVEDEFVPYFYIPAILWFMTGYEWFAAWRQAPRAPFVWALAAAVITLFSVYKLVKLRSSIRSLRLGRDGERAVGQFLDGLRVQGARIFHDIPAEGFNLDHVVISTHGVYVVETKTLSKPWPDAKVTFDGSKVLVAGKQMDRDPITQVRAEVTYLTRLLEESTGMHFAVRGAIAFPGWFVETQAGGRRSDVWVLEPKALPKWIENEPEQLSPSDVALAAYHLSRHIRAVEAERKSS